MDRRINAPRYPSIVSTADNYYDSFAENFR